jgi:hypothetical protein
MRLMSFSLRLLGQHMGLIYPMLLFSLLMDGLRPQEGLTFEWRWLVLLLLFLLIKVAFTGGWYGCICLAVEDALTERKRQSPDGDTFQVGTNKPATPSLWPKTFRFYKAFFPTIGRYFIPLACGEGLLLAVQLGLVLLLLWWGVHSIGLPQTALPSVDVMSSSKLLSEWLLALPAADMSRVQQLSSLMIGCFGLMLLLQSLTAFWVFFVILLQQNPIKALFHSVGFSLKNLLPLAVQFLPIFLLFGCFGLLSAVQSPWLSFIGVMGITVSMLLMVIMASSFFYHRFDQAQLLPLNEGDNKPVSSEKPVT